MDPARKKIVLVASSWTADLFLSLLYKCFIREYRFKLITGNGYDKHSEQDRLHDEEDAVEDPRLFDSYVLQ